jgi:hypothetical protein
MPFMEFKKPPESHLIVLDCFPYFLTDRSKIDNTIERRDASSLLGPRRVHQSQDVAFLGIIGQSMEVPDLIQAARSV